MGKVLDSRHFPARGGPLLSVDVTLTEVGGGGRKARYVVDASPPDRTCAPIRETFRSREAAESRFRAIVDSLKGQSQRTPRW